MRLHVICKRIAFAPEFFSYICELGQFFHTDGIFEDDFELLFLLVSPVVPPMVLGSTPSWRGLHFLAYRRRKVIPLEYLNQYTTQNRAYIADTEIKQYSFSMHSEYVLPDPLIAKFMFR